MGLHQFISDPHNSVVWRVSGLSDYQRVLPQFITAAKAAGQQVCYIHFAGQSLAGPEEAWKDVKICEVPLSHQFEAFTIAVHKAISDKTDTFFLFDSLSELQTAWATDLMMENFFRVIMPEIKSGAGRAFLPLVRSMHSAQACEEIRKGTDAFVDLYADFSRLYLHAVKAGEEALSEELAQPCLFTEKQPEFLPITDGEILRRYLRTAAAESRLSRTENRDSWEQFFDRTQKKYEEGMPVDEECRRMSEIMMSRDPHIREMLLRHFSPVDYFGVREHMVGTGLIGGKACGMLIARKIIENRCPDIFERMEAHDSFFIGSDVFYSYIVDNHFWDLRVRQRTEEGYFAVADEFAERLRTGIFSEKLEKEFIRVLEYYGNCPVIVRSSSILEDGFGNAFAGKYESVFCMGTGTLEERLAEFENAIRIVYASTMSRSALDYRLRRGMSEKDEQMSLLVMRVSGSFYGDYYFPCAAGVGYSYSTYRFMESLDPKAGMLRLVMGLGTSAVDRTEGSYPRLVSLDRPQATPYRNLAEHHRYSQKRAEVINTKTSCMERLDPEVLRGLLPLKKRNLLYQHDTEVESRYRERGIRKEITFVSCPGLVNNRQLMGDLQRLMQTIQSEYGQAVDIEYAINPDDRGMCLINLLQCRPLQVFKNSGKASVPKDLRPEEVLLDCRKSSMGMSQTADLDYIVYIDPVGYYNMPYNEKQKAAQCVGRINWRLRGQNKKLILLSPGRLGTSSPELGVPTTFADISEFCAVFEVASSAAGYNPELSYGSHMFQDLVENDILYAAVFENEKTAAYRPALLQSSENCLEALDPDSAGLEDIIRVADVKGRAVMYHDMLNERLVITMKAPGEENR